MQENIPWANCGRKVRATDSRLVDNYLAGGQAVSRTGGQEQVVIYILFFTAGRGELEVQVSGSGKPNVQDSTWRAAAGPRGRAPR